MSGCKESTAGWMWTPVSWGANGEKEWSITDGIRGPGPTWTKNKLLDCNPRLHQTVFAASSQARPRLRRRWRSHRHGPPFPGFSFSKQGKVGPGPWILAVSLNPEHYFRRWRSHKADQSPATFGSRLFASPPGPTQWKATRNIGEHYSRWTKNCHTTTFPTSSDQPAFRPCRAYLAL